MKKRNLALAMVLAMAMTTMGSATVFADDASDDAAGNDYTIAYVPTTMNNPFWTAMLGGIKEEMEAKGMDVDSQLVTVDANSDQATMNNYVNDLIAQEVDAIILAPMDCTAVTEALQACEDAGIPVINVDTAVDASDKVVSIIASDNYKAGVECAKDMMSKLDEGSKIAVMDQPSGTACVQREQGFLDTVGDYFEIASTTDTEGDTAKTMTAAEDVLTADDDLAAFFCINDPSALGAAAAVKAANKTGKIGVYSIDASPDGKQALIDGEFTAVACQVPVQIAEYAFNAAQKYVGGDTTIDEKKVYLDSHLVLKDEAEKTVNDWQ